MGVRIGSDRPFERRPDEDTSPAEQFRVDSYETSPEVQDRLAKAEGGVEGSTVRSPREQAVRVVDEVDEEIEKFVTDTLIAFGKRILEHVADAHGLGPALRTAEFVYEVVQWRQVAEGDGTVEAEASIPLGPGVDLELSGPLAGDRDSPGLPLTVCCAPSGGSSVGVVEIGRLEIGPSADHEHAHPDSRHSMRPAEPENESLRRQGGLVFEDAADTAAGAGQSLPSDARLSEPARRYEVVQWDLSTVGKVDSREEDLAALEYGAEQELRWLRSKLRAFGTRFVVLYDPVTGRLLWLCLHEDDQSPRLIWHIKVTIDLSTGRLSGVDVRE